MTNNSSWLALTKELKEIRQRGEPLRAEWQAFDGSEEHGIWLLLPEGPETEEVRASFGLFAARAIQKLGIPPIPVPSAHQHFVDWDQYCELEEEMARRCGKPIGLSGAVPYGLCVEDQDAVDRYTRGWLEWLRQHSAAFRSSEGSLSLLGRAYRSFSGTIGDLFGASLVCCTRLARDETGAGLVKQSAPKVKKRVRSAQATTTQIRDRAARRHAVVSPILGRKRWKPSRLATESGVGKATVYGYLDGTRSWIDKTNHKAIADALGLKVKDLPD